MRDPPFPVCKGCDKQMVTAPCGGLAFRLVLLSRAGSKIRGNLTSRSGSAKESYFRHSSMGYLKRQSCSIPCMLQDPFQAHGFGRDSARGCVPSHPVLLCAAPLLPRALTPAADSRCLSKRPFPKSCELLHGPALPDKMIYPISFLFLHFITLLNVSWILPSLAPPFLVPSQMPGPGPAPMLT